ncbi:SDR family oxidoreductase [Vibrio navarrensis]|nr:SDR family oxidoreductase [Vibrio navarrensis]
MNNSPRILVAGSTGYLGSHIVKQLLEQQMDFKALARSRSKLQQLGVDDAQIVQAQVTDAQQLQGICDGVEVVISCLGITRQRDGLSYADVDYGANLNLLLEAERAGVKKFIYISAFNAAQFPKVRLLNAKERFARRLLSSTTVTPCVIRPNGFFSDLEEIYHMAKSGRAYLFGQGELKLNPIHGADLARFCLEAISRPEQELDVGGPDVLSAKQIAQLAFDALEREAKLTHLPDWMRRTSLVIAQHLPEKWAGPFEFFLAAMGKDAIAPRYGCHHLKDHYRLLAKQTHHAARSQ